MGIDRRFYENSVFILVVLGFNGFNSVFILVLLEFLLVFTWLFSVYLCDGSYKVSASEARDDATVTPRLLFDFLNSLLSGASF